MASAKLLAKQSKGTRHAIYLKKEEGLVVATGRTLEGRLPFSYLPMHAQAIWNLMVNKTRDRCAHVHSYKSACACASDLRRAKSTAWIVEALVAARSLAARLSLSTASSSPFKSGGCCCHSCCC